MSYVYFIRCGAHVKIGVATDLSLRLSAIQIGSPEPMRIVAVIENAGIEKERELHTKFAALRVRGEWFSIEGELAEYLGTLPAYERESDPFTVVRRFLSKHVERVYRADSFVKDGVVYLRYLQWCQQNGWPPLSKAAALRIFYEWFAQRGYLLSGGTALRPRWSVFGAAVSRPDGHHIETASAASC